MEDDEDDFYASNAHDQQYEHGTQQAHERDGRMDTSDIQDEDEEDSDDVWNNPDKCHDLVVLIKRLYRMSNSH
jgi:hypothetical protein